MRADIALNDRGNVVIVYETDSSSVINWNIFYQTGDLDEDSMRIKFNKWVKYDTGKYPTVVIDQSGTVIQIHCSVRKTYGLLYRIGRFEGKKITFDDSTWYGYGYLPSAAVTEQGHFIATHRNQSDDQLYFHAGVLRGEGLTVDLKACHYESKGTSQSITAAIVDGTVVLVEAHEYSSELYWEAEYLSPQGGQSK